MSNAVLPFPRRKTLYATDTGISAASCAGAITGSQFGAEGYNNLVLYCNYTRSAGTGTISLSVEAFDDVQAAWFTLQTSAITAGAVALSAMSLDKATGSASQAYEIRLTALNFKWLRIKMAAAVTNATSSDTLTITGELSFQA